MRVLRIGVALLALPAVAACAPSEAQARDMVDAMVNSSLFSPPPGASIVQTRKDFCGGGSVAPLAERHFKGKLVDPEGTYRQRLVDEGWNDVRDVPAGGVGAAKGNRIVLIRAMPDGWSVFMQEGDAAAACDGDSPGEEVTRGK